MPRHPGIKNKRTVQKELLLRQEEIATSILERAPDFMTLVKQDPKDLSKEIIQAELAKIMAKIVTSGQVSQVDRDERQWVLAVYKTLLENKTPHEKALDKLETDVLLQLLKAEEIDVSPAPRSEATSKTRTN